MPDLMQKEMNEHASETRDHRADVQDRLAPVGKPERINNDRERHWLCWYAGFTVIWLVSWSLVGLMFLALLISSESEKEEPTSLLYLCLVAGTVSSSIAALLSATGRIANGWEFTSGNKYPKDIPKDKFVARMIPSFMVRPFLGTVMGSLVYAGVASGFLIATKHSKANELSAEGLVFLALLGGLFAKTLLERLKDVFKAIFGGTDKAQS